MIKAFALLGIVACAASLSPASATQYASSAPAPTGVVVVVTPEDLTGTQWRAAVANPSVSGVAVQIHWSDLEPSDGGYVWTQLDDVFATAHSHQKWVALLAFPGFFTPSWALQGVATDQFPFQYGPGVGTVAPLPMPWDPTYLTRWSSFLKALATRYGTSPDFRMIAADGPTSVSAEFTLPNSPQDQRQWRADGYTPSRYVSAWQQIFSTYAADFPNQYVSLSVGTGLPIGDDGRVDPSQRLQTRDDIVAQARAVLGSRLALQLSDVHGGPGPRLLNSQAEDAYVIGFIGTSITGLQMRTAAENDPAIMGADGDPAAALRKSIDLAMEPGAGGRHVDLLEIYQRDVLAPELQPDLQYAASLFSGH
jgi:hypothetical protein